MGLQHVVITSVDRDDLPERRRRGVRRLHHRDPAAAARDLGRGADPRLQGLRAGAPASCWTRGPTSSTTTSRPPSGSTGWPVPAGATTARSSCWRAPGGWRPTALTKTGIILGMGEEWDEVLVCMRDLRRSDVNILTLGPVPPAVGGPPPGRPLLHAGRVRGAARHRPGDGLHSRAGEPAHALLLPRVGAGARGRERGRARWRTTARTPLGRAPARRPRPRPRRRLPRLAPADAPHPPLRGEGRRGVRARQDRRLLPPVHRAGSGRGRQPRRARARTTTSPRLPRARPGARARHHARAR